MIKELATQLDETSVEIEKIQTAISEKIQDLQADLQLAQKKDSDLRAQLKTVMAEQGIKNWKSELFSITYIAPSTRVIVDSKKLKEENPDLYAKYSKESKVSDSVRITIKTEEIKAEVH